MCVDEIEEENEKERKGKEMQYNHITFQMDFIMHAEYMAEFVENKHMRLEN